MGLLKRHKCCCCGNMATWHYNSKKNDKKIRSFYYCDECVPRGSYWNVFNLSDYGEPNGKTKIMWWDSSALAKDLDKNGSLDRGEKSFYYEYLDIKGRRNPDFNRYTFMSNGFPICLNEKSYSITFNEVTTAIKKIEERNNSKSRTDKGKSIPTFNMKFLSEVTEEIFIESARGTKEHYVTDYNSFMTKLGHEMKKTFEKLPNNSSKKNFIITYQMLKSELFKRKYSK